MGIENSHGGEGSDSNDNLTDSQLRDLYEVYRGLDEAKLETIIHFDPNSTERMIMLATGALAEKRRARGACTDKDPLLKKTLVDIIENDHRRPGEPKILVTPKKVI